MNQRAEKSGVALGILIFLFGICIPLRAQDSNSSLSGVITSAAGAVVPNAKVAIKNLASGQSRETQTDSGGHYICRT